MDNFLRYQLPFIIWIGFIFFLSSLSRLPEIEVPIISIDKLAHMFIYFILCALSWRAFYFQTMISTIKKWALSSAFIFTCIYGYLDEVHQMFVPNRTFDYYDWVADIIGAIIFIVLFNFKRKQLNTS